MKLGVAYYPEHWPEAEWDADFALMAEAGIELVRMAEFAWCRMEPEEGRYDFSWLDRAVDAAARHGIKSILCTPTEAPPPWVSRMYPETLPWDREGRPYTPGSRRHCDPASDTFIRLSDAITTAMARHYGNNPNVVGWQLDNEAGCHTQLYSSSPASLEKFRVWLKERYGSVAALNEAWGTIFWSGEYNDFNEVEIYTNPAYELSPAYKLDYHRFCSDVWLNFLERQAQILRAHTRNQFITHNITYYGERFDFYRLRQFLDVVGIDIYQTRPELVSMVDDLIYSVGDGAFGVMEMPARSPIGINGGRFGRTHGQLCQWLVKHALHGAQFASLFRFQPSPSGYEMFGGMGLRDMSGRVTPTVNELKQARQAIEQLKPVLSKPRAFDAAIIYDSEDWFVSYTSGKRLGVDFYVELNRYHQALAAHGVGVRFVRPEDDLSGYKLVLAPVKYILRADQAASLRNYVAQGGTLMALGRVGYITEGGRRTREEMPVGLTDLFGAAVATMAEPGSVPVDSDIKLMVKMAGGAEFPIGGPVCTIEPRGARVVGEYINWSDSDNAAVTENPWGNGRAVLVGPVLSKPGVNSVVAYLLQLAGITSLCDQVEMPAGVELLHERGALVFFNHTGEEQQVTLRQGSYCDQIDGSDVGSSVTIAPWGWRCLCRKA